eukprot:GFUD01017296.1.p1 GENE.GFUD01017296.1~~GFUD01017296.1.p1  ORF type:complete len:267 (-),score=93.15 GFUD01017296.1:9-809(-)
MLKWSVRNTQAMSTVPQPRLCHVKKWAHFDGYGFNLHGDKHKPGQLIGKIDDNSPAQAAGLKIGDRIHEIEGVNVMGDNHKQVVQRIQVSGDGTEVRLLVADKECEAYHDDQDVDISSSLNYILHLSSEKNDETSSESEEEEEEPPRQMPAIHQASDSDEGVGELSSFPEEDEEQGGGSGNKLRQSMKSVSRSSSSSSEENVPVPRKKPSYKAARTSYNKNELVAGLNLNMSAKEMRQRVGSSKKTDPRIDDPIDLKKKYELINNL